MDHGMRAVAVQGDFAYVVTNSLGTAPGTLQVVRIGDPATAEVVHSLELARAPSDRAGRGGGRGVRARRDRRAPGL